MVASCVTCCRQHGKHSEDKQQRQHEQPGQRNGLQGDTAEGTTAETV